MEEWDCDIHANNDFSFREVCEKSRRELLNYLIFQYGMEKTTAIDDYLNCQNLCNFTRIDTQEVLHMFEKRNLEERLQAKLPKKSKVESKSKI